jgi:probable F420-dependent oxidoreductase
VAAHRTGSTTLTMRIDLWVPTANPFSTPEVLAAVGAGAEERGAGCIWVGEHVVLFDEYESSYPYAEDGKVPSPPGSGLLEPLNTLSFLAAHTTTVRLGTAMVLLPQRNPVYTAKEVATLDWLSNGRVDLGIGVGWLEEEFDAVNVPWPRRGARTDEYLQVLRTLWRDDPSSFEGEFYSLNPCSMFPKPIQQPQPPIHIGGESDAALRRTARFAQGWHTFNRTPDGLATPMARLNELLSAEGRKRSEVRVTVCPYFKPLDADIAERYAEAGADAVSALIVPLSVDDVRSQLDGLQPVFDRAAALSA